MNRFEQNGDARWLVLPIAVHRHQHIVTMLHGVLERRDEGGPIASVLRMRDDRQVAFLGEDFSRAVGRAVVDHEQLGTGATHFLEDVRQVLGFVVDRDGGDPAHAEYLGAWTATRPNDCTGQMRRVKIGAFARTIPACGTGRHKSTLTAGKFFPRQPSGPLGSIKRTDRA